MTNPSVSVVIATYHNPPKYSDREFVTACVASVRAQTVQPIEAVVVDGSPDVRMGNSAWNPKLSGLADVFGALPRLHGKEKFSDDVCSSFQFGVHLTRSQWVVPMNADDQLAPHFVESALAVIERSHHIDLDGQHNLDVQHNYAPCQCTGVVVVSQQPLSAAIERDNYIPYLAMFARWFWDAMGGFVDVLGEGGACRLADWDLWIRIWQRYGDRAPVAYITDPSVIRLRDRPDSASKWSSDEFEALRARLWAARGIES